MLEKRAPGRRRDVIDLLRGALDAWLQPGHAVAGAGDCGAHNGGGLWTMAAAGVVGQPVPPDWPGYLAEIVLVAAGRGLPAARRDARLRTAGR